MTRSVHGLIECESWRADWWSIASTAGNKSTWTLFSHDPTPTTRKRPNSVAHSRIFTGGVRTSRGAAPLCSYLAVKVHQRLNHLNMAYGTWHSGIPPCQQAISLPCFVWLAACVRPKTLLKPHTYIEPLLIVYISTCFVLRFQAFSVFCWCATDVSSSCLYEWSTSSSTSQHCPTTPCATCPLPCTHCIGFTTLSSTSPRCHRWSPPCFPSSCTSTPHAPLRRTNMSKRCCTKAAFLRPRQTDNVQILCSVSMRVAKDHAPLPSNPVSGKTPGQTKLERTPSPSIGDRPCVHPRLSTTFADCACIRWLVNLWYSHHWSFNRPLWGWEPCSRAGQSLWTWCTLRTERAAHLIRPIFGPINYVWGEDLHSFRILIVRTGVQ